MAKNPILDLPLRDVLRFEIALPLQQLFQIYTVGSLLMAWRSPTAQRSIEQLFDTPEQARHAVATCAAWLGIRMEAIPCPIAGWWSGDDRPAHPV